MFTRGYIPFANHVDDSTVSHGFVILQVPGALYGTSINEPRSSRHLRFSAVFSGKPDLAWRIDGDIIWYIYWNIN
jgi:hypothetical protein